MAWLRQPQIRLESQFYPQADVVFGYSVPAYGMYLRHVNLMLQNFVFNLLSPDARPAVVMDDCHHIRLNNFDVDVPTIISLWCG